MFTYSIKLKLIWIFALISSFVWILENNFLWWQVLCIFYLSVFVSRVGGEISYHRYFTHKSFKTNNFFHTVLLWWGSLLGVGSCISWSCMHRAHHYTADTELDPHSPKNIGLFKTFFLTPDTSNLSFNNVKDLIKDKQQSFIHKNYFKIIIFWVAFLLSLSYYSIIPFVVLFALPVSILWFMSGVTNCFGHLYGYRNFDTKDNSTNHHISRWLMLNTGLHNNHHYKPASVNLNLNNKWYEFDIENYLIKLIRT